MVRFQFHGKENIAIDVISTKVVIGTKAKSMIMEHPKVLECAEVGASDDENLIEPKAFVVLQSGNEPNDALAKETIEYVKKTLAHYKYPRWVEFVDELPKTATGKIKRFMLMD